MQLHRLCTLALPLLAIQAYADPFTLGTASYFAVLGGSTVTNTGPTVITGSLGVSPGSAVTGFPPGTVSGGSIYKGTAVAAQAQTDTTTAYNYLAGLGVTENLTGDDLGGLTLTPGVYKFDSSAQLTGTLTLNAQGNNDAYWVFLIGSTLTTASASSVTFTNLGSSPDDGLFWQVGSSATLGTTTTFEGNILALTSIELDTGATIDCGRALAQNGAVTMDTNTISIGCTIPLGGVLEGTNGLSGGISSVPPPPPPPPPVPEPGSIALLGSGLIGLAGVLRRRLHM